MEIDNFSVTNYRYMPDRLFSKMELEVVLIIIILGN